MTDTPSNDAPATEPAIDRYVTDNDIFPQMMALWPELGGYNVEKLTMEILGHDYVRVHVTRLLRQGDAHHFLRVAQQYRLVKVGADLVEDSQPSQKDGGEDGKQENAAA